MWEVSTKWHLFLSFCRCIVGNVKFFSRVFKVPYFCILCIQIRKLSDFRETFRKCLYGKYLQTVFSEFWLGAPNGAQAQNRAKIWKLSDFRETFRICLYVKYLHKNFFGILIWSPKWATGPKKGGNLKIYLLLQFCLN